MAKNTKKVKRQEQLVDMLSENPFYTDEELAACFSVSVPTIRLDRLELNISEHKERLKQVATEHYQKVKTLITSEFVGELIDIEPGKSAMSILEPDEGMVFEKSQVVKGHHIYAMAETLSIAAIDAQSAIVKVANIKYKKPVYAHARLVAKAEVKKARDNDYIVWVFIYENRVEVFRGKFMLVSLD